MMTVFLIRHAEHCGPDGVLMGRSKGVALSPKGMQDARAIAERFKTSGIECVQSSPRQRCLETARALAETIGLPVCVERALDEMDFGLWTGQPLEALEADSLWRLWNRYRGRIRPPGGETAIEAQARISDHLSRMNGRYRTIAVVTHAEMIRHVLLKQAGLALSEWPKIAVPLGSVTPVVVTRCRPEVPAASVAAAG